MTLQMSQDGSARDLATSKTNAHGTYTFTNLATDKTVSYALYISYQGAQYTSNVITLASKSVQQMNLTVYDATAKHQQYCNYPIYCADFRSRIHKKARLAFLNYSILRTWVYKRLLVL